jgi:hypothetical protein
MHQKTAGRYVKSKQNFLLLLLLPVLCSVAQPVADGLRVKQSGSVLTLTFPLLKNRSALKVTDLQGNLVRGMLVDENSTSAVVQLQQYRKGVHIITLQNREQQFSAQVSLY